MAAKADIDGVKLGPMSKAIATFARDGATVIRGLFSSAEIDLLREGMDLALADPSPRAIVASAKGDPGRFVEDFCNWRRIGAFERFVRESAIAAVAVALMGADTVRFHHDHLLVKEPGATTRTPWHQDQPYYSPASINLQ